MAYSCWAATRRYTTLRCAVRTQTARGACRRATLQLYAAVNFIC